jgi:hypothetical protein
MSGNHADDKPLDTDTEERRREQWERYRRFKKETPAEPSKKRKSQKDV